jgi:hypothetical protein
MQSMTLARSLWRESLARSSRSLSTLADQVDACASVLRPIYDRLSPRKVQGKTSAVISPIALYAVRAHRCPVRDWAFHQLLDADQRKAARQDRSVQLAVSLQTWMRTNGLTRDFFPKGTEFSTIANAEVAKVTPQIPRLPFIARGSWCIA